MAELANSQVSVKEGVRPLIESIYEQRVMRNSNLESQINGGADAHQDSKALQSFREEEGANSISAWLLSFSFPNAWNALALSK